jgi:hypothetical protein
VAVVEAATVVETIVAGQAEAVDEKLAERLHAADETVVGRPELHDVTLNRQLLDRQLALRLEPKKD